MTTSLVPLVPAAPPVPDVVLISFVNALLDFLSPTNLAQVFLDGLAKSAIFVMLAAGLTLVFGLMGVLNFAHGSLTMVGAYVAGVVMVVAVTSNTGGLTRLVLFFAAVALVFAVLTGVGAAVEVGLIRPLYDRPPLYQILLTFGLTLVLDELVRIGIELVAVLDAVTLFGVTLVKLPAELQNVQPSAKWQAAIGTKPDFVGKTYETLGVRATGLELFQILAGALVVAGVWAFLTRTRYGLYIRAGSEDSEMAEALGINVRRAFTVVFGVGIGVAGVAGALLMWDPAWGASVPLGADALLPAFVVVIVGGLGTFRGTVVAAVLVGMTDAAMTWWFQNVVDFAGLPELMVFLILVIVLIVKPQGLYGVQEVGGH